MRRSAESNRAQDLRRGGDTRRSQSFISLFIHMVIVIIQNTMGRKEFISILVLIIKHQFDSALLLSQIGKLIYNRGTSPKANNTKMLPVD